MIGPDDIIKRVTEENAAAIAKAEKDIDKDLIKNFRGREVAITISETDDYVVQTLVDAYRKAGWSVTWAKKGGSSQMDEPYTELRFSKYYADCRSIEDIK